MGDKRCAGKFNYGGALYCYRILLVVCAFWVSHFNGRNWLLFWSNARNERVFCGERAAFQRVKTRLFFFEKGHGLLQRKAVKRLNGGGLFFVYEKELAPIYLFVHEHAQTNGQQIEREKCEKHGAPIGARIASKLRCLAFRARALPLSFEYAVER